MTSAARVTAYAFFLCAAFISLLPMFTHAQFDYGSGADFTLLISPEHPAPGDSVTVTAKSSSLNLTTTPVTWYVNGTSRAGDKGTSIQVVAGALGSKTTVDAVVGSTAAGGTAIIRPTEMDLLWESDSYVPPFFRGRALPSAGTALRLQALTRFKRDTVTVPDSSITFTWRRNGYVIQSVSGAGKSQAVIDAPPLFGTDIISVDAETGDGQLSASASVRIPSATPVLALYEDHPLFGILYHSALGAQNAVPESEMSFAAAPYYVGASSASDPELEYAWQVNGQAIGGDPAHPGEITISATNSNGIALIELALGAVHNFFLSASGSWGVTLSTNGSSGGGGSNPFNGTAQ